MAKKSKLSEEKQAESLKTSAKRGASGRTKNAVKPGAAKVLKVAPKKDKQAKSKALDAACDAVGKMLPDGAKLASGAASTDSRGAKLIPETSTEVEYVLKRHSKQSLLITLLKHPEGASLSQIMKATGWQAHTVRGVISGVLRKKLCFKVVQERGLYGTAVYKIVEAA